jgi:hypothetical protein
MVLQELALIEPLQKHQGPAISGLLSSIGGISPSSFLFLRGRTRARGCACADHLLQADAGEQVPYPF